MVNSIKGSTRSKETMNVEKLWSMEWYILSSARSNAVSVEYNMR